MSRPYAEVIGDPIGHSKSPLIHGFWLAALGIDADYRVTRVTAEELPAFLVERNRDDDWRGCNVTLPHKQAVIHHLDAIDPSATAVGAVNTITMKDWLLKGHNTDASGFIEPLLPLLAHNPKHRFVHMVGAGGAALAVAKALHDANFTLIAYNRDPQKAEQTIGRYVWDKDLMLDLSFLAEPVKSTELGGDRFDLFVNATSLGMTGRPSLNVHPSQFCQNMVVYDIVYSPLETPLLAMARAEGRRTIDGLAMLIGQAAGAFELFFGQTPPRELDDELRALLIR